MLDWRKEEDYEYTEHLSLEGWAWELLRRIPEYGNDYENVQLIKKKYEPCIKAHSSNCKASFLKPPFLPDKCREYYHYLPERLENEPLQKWKLRCVLEENMEPEFCTKEKWYAKKWHIQHKMADPAQGLEQGITFLPLSRFPQLIDDWDKMDKYADNNDYATTTVMGKAILVFDITTPLKPQSDKAYKLLNKIQAGYEADNLKLNWNPLEHCDLYTSYLRIHDASIIGASRKQMAQVLFSGMNEKDPTFAPKKAWDTLKQANKRISYNGYCGLIQKLF